MLNCENCLLTLVFAVTLKGEGKLTKKKKKKKKGSTNEEIRLRFARIDFKIVSEEQSRCLALHSIKKQARPRRESLVSFLSMLYSVID